MTICVRPCSRLRGAPCPNNPTTGHRETGGLPLQSCTPLRRECGTYVQGKTIMARKVPAYQMMIYRIPCAETYQWLGIKQTQQKHMRECCFTAARLLWAHTHTNTSADSMGPLIIRNPVLLLIPHSSHVLQGWLCSLCIYLSVVQRLHAGEIKSKGQRAGGIWVHCWTQRVHVHALPGKHQHGQTSSWLTPRPITMQTSNPFIVEMKSAGILETDCVRDH